MSIAEKLTTIAENQHRVYEAGKADLLSNFTSFSYFFENGRNMAFYDLLPTLDMSHITLMQYAFNNNTVLTEFVAPPTMAIASPHGMFQNCTSVKTVSGLERGLVATCPAITDLFAGCTSLEDAGTLNFANIRYASRTFHNCTALKEIRIVGTIGLTIDLQYSPLSKGSIESVVSALSDSASGCTVTFKQTAVDAAFTTDEWNALKATKPNWTIAVV